MFTFLLLNNTTIYIYNRYVKHSISFNTSLVATCNYFFYQFFVDNRFVIYLGYFCPESYQMQELFIVLGFKLNKLLSHAIDLVMMSNGQPVGKRRIDNQYEAHGAYFNPQWVFVMHYDTGTNSYKRCMYAMQ